MYALQKALRAQEWPWFKIGGHPKLGDIPWIWLFKDSALALHFNEWGWPFIIGPNVLFANSATPGSGNHETELLDAESCALQFTESNWYSALIQQHCDRNEAPIVLWRYPIEPKPGGPLEAEFDLLVYLKDMTKGREMMRAVERWPRSNVAVYGHYNREEMIEIARRSRCCLYLSSDDRGPLAAAEIALAGCPLVGVERGCPWVSSGDGVGLEVRHFGQPGLFDACAEAMTYNRDGVRDAALRHFDTKLTVETIRKALEPIAMEDGS